jgi:hypothetical protein
MRERGGKRNRASARQKEGKGNVLQTVCRKLQEDSEAGGFDLEALFSWLERPRNRMRRDLDFVADVLMGFHRPRRSYPLPLFNRATLTLH